MPNESTELNIDLNLPDHSEELYEVEDYINKIKKQIQQCTADNKLDDKTYTALYDKITNALYYVGGLSMPAFDVQEKLEEEYFNTYKHAPELARKLWLDHYARIHRPYNILKNRLFRMYDNLDELYIKINKKNLPEI